MKYPFYDGEDKTPHTEKAAIKRMNKFIEVCREHNANEKSFHLFIEDGFWRTYADSMKDTATGEHFKEFIL